MDKIIETALISVFDKSGLEPVIKELHRLGVKIYSTGVTLNFIEQLNFPCYSVESITGFPSIFGGRVKTLHPKIFGGILARRHNPEDLMQQKEYQITLFDLVIVDLYPFQETVDSNAEEQAIIEKIDIGGVSLIRAAAKNFQDVCVIATKIHYPALMQILGDNNGHSNITERRKLAAYAFIECSRYDNAIAQYFSQTTQDLDESYSIENHLNSFLNQKQTHLRYGENPHQKATFLGNIEEVFTKLNGKELSYNNLVDIDAACKLIAEFSNPVFAIIKHTNVCGIAERENIDAAWDAAIECDKESAFGGVLICNRAIDETTATKINELFFEILIAPAFSTETLNILTGKKNRILLEFEKEYAAKSNVKSVLNGLLIQNEDNANCLEWNQVAGSGIEKEVYENLLFANIVCKHLKSNAIAIVKNKQLIGKGCGQTSRVDAFKQAVAKAHSFGFSTKDAFLASDAFFPFDDCVRLAYVAGISAIIQPGGSIKDKDSIDFCKTNNIILVLTGTRHFKH